jgi:predicted O-methyltransferase YrrM
MIPWWDIVGANDMGPYQGLYKQILRGSEPDTIVELGVRRGVSARILLEAKPPAATMYLIDPVKLPEVEELIGDKVVFLQEPGENAVEYFRDSSVDFLHIDTDPHSEEQTKLLFDLYAPKMRLGGVVVFHDACQPWGVYSFLVGDLRAREGWELVFYPPKPESPHTAPAAAWRVY